MRPLDRLGRILITPLAKLASTPEVLRLRAELAEVYGRLDEFEQSMEAKLLALKHELYAEIKKLELRVQETERQNKALRLRVEAMEREMRKLPSIKPNSPDKEIGLA
jgi:chromosome segregation ATPase